MKYIAAAALSCKLFGTKVRTSLMKGEKPQNYKVMF